MPSSVCSFSRLSVSHEHLSEIISLYLSAFPPNERRDADLWRELLEKGVFSGIVLSVGGQFAGFLTYWDFPTFSYAEHLAVSPARRNQGFGARLLREWQAHFPAKPLLLEAEPPTDEWSERRIGFYRRQGFLPLPISYSQLPYRQGEKPFPLLLLSNTDRFSPDSLTQMVGQLQKAVYLAHQ